jgi:hypothetical protein
MWPPISAFQDGNRAFTKDRSVPSGSAESLHRDIATTGFSCSAIFTPPDNLLFAGITTTSYVNGEVLIAPCHEARYRPICFIAFMIAEVVS